MNKLSLEDKDYIISNLTSFLLKEGEAPASAETHLNTALFRVIEQLSEEELQTVLENKGEGFYAVLEISSYLLGKPLPEKYKPFFEEFNRISELEKK